MGTNLPPRGPKRDKTLQDKKNRQPGWLRNLPQLLVEPGSGQLTSAEDKTEGSSDSFSFMVKVPLEERVNPFIKPDDEKFLEIERYFESLLRINHLSLDQILESNFDSHEISLITPTSGPSDVVKWQKEDSVRYQRLLHTTFKGKVPSIQLKMAMLYFGLPVAPLKIGRIQTVGEQDLNFLEDRSIFDRDPLEFLEDHTERFFGDATRRTTRREPFNNIPTQIFTSMTLSSDERMSLRGGSLETSLLPEVEYQGLGRVAIANPGDKEDDEHFNPKASAPVLVMGFQGVIPSTADYDGFVASVDRLLGRQDRTDYDVCADIFEVAHDGTVKDQPPVESVTGRIYHGSITTPNPIIDAVRKYLNTDPNVAIQQISLFVRYPKEQAPRSPKPRSNDRGVVAFVDLDSSRIAYMKTPANLNDQYKPNQYGSLFSKAIRFLQNEPVDGNLKFDITNLDNSVTIKIDGHSFGWLHPPPALWDQLGKYTGSQKNPDSYQYPVVTIKTTSEKAEDYAPVLVTGFHSQTLGLHPVKHSISRMHFLGASVARETDAVQILWDVALESNPDLAGFKDFEGVDIWAPGWHISDPSSKTSHKIMEINNPRSHVARRGWRDFRTAFTAKHPIVTTPSTSLLVRPNFSSYRLHASDKVFAVDIMKMTLSQLMQYARTNLFPGLVSLGKKCLYMRQTTWNRASVTAVIREESTEDEWAWFVNHIVEPDITVSLESWDNQWALCPQNPWGHRYDRDTVVQLASIGRIHAKGTSTHFGIHGTTDPFRAVEPTDAPRTTNSSRFKGPFKTPKSTNSPGTKNTPSTTNTAKATPANNNIVNFSASDSIDSPFGIPGNTETAAQRAARLRLRYFWDTPQIFADPTKPTMPIHGAPLESVLRTGPHTPGITVAMRTSSEVARLEREVHSLRNQLLQRTRECPYADCYMGPFHYENTAGLDLHMREQHHILRCFLCTDEEALLPYYDKQSVQDHFVKQHAEELRKLVSMDEKSDEERGKKNMEKEKTEKKKNVEEDKRKNSAEKEKAAEEKKRAGEKKRKAEEEKGKAAEQRVEERERAEGTERSADRLRELEARLKQSLDASSGVSAAKTNPDDRKDPKNKKNLNSEKKNKDDPNSSDSFNPGMPLWRAALPGESAGRARAKSPDWETVLGPSDPTYRPPFTARCSRCFRAAGENLERIEAHMDPNGSCRIRRGRGDPGKASSFPNHSGWIEYPNNINFTKAFEDFTARYPAYRHTMFPTSDTTGQVREVYYDLYDEETSYGWNQDDPNDRREGNIYEATQSGLLPWPPYPGRVIPLVGQAGARSQTPPRKPSKEPDYDDLSAPGRPRRNKPDPKDKPSPKDEAGTDDNPPWLKYHPEWFQLLGRAPTPHEEEYYYKNYPGFFAGRPFTREGVARQPLGTSGQLKRKSPPDSLLEDYGEEGSEASDSLGTSSEDTESSDEVYSLYDPTAPSDRRTAGPSPRKKRLPAKKEKGSAAAQDGPAGDHPSPRLRRSTRISRSATGTPDEPLPTHPNNKASDTSTGAGGR